jgi:hypothetical protein
MSMDLGHAGDDFEPEILNIEDTIFSQSSI